MILLVGELIERFLGRVEQTGMRIVKFRQRVEQLGDEVACIKGRQVLSVRCKPCD